MHSSLQELLFSSSFEQSTLEELALNDSQRANAFGITNDNVSDRIRLRFELFQAIYPEFIQLCDRASLSPLPIDPLWNLWLPLAFQLAQWRNQCQHQCLIQGFLGGQGAGKTTLTTILSLILKQLNYQCVNLSLDDLYLPYPDRVQLQQHDPRLVRRGPPGTHDIQLGLQVLQQFREGQFPIELPRFDKSLHQGAGDRTLAEIVTHADILLFEGWFVGVRPIDPMLFRTAPNPIVTPFDRQFAQDMNERLQDYLPLWKFLDRLIVLYVPNYQLSQQWRKQAEHLMIAQGKSGMGDTEIDQFVEYFWKALHPELFITPLIHNPKWVDLVIEINPDHQPGAVYRPKSLD
jgi:D-glycerate 3-kinase